MTLAIIILSYLLWLGDIGNYVKTAKSNTLISGSLVVLLSWQQNTPWGITMLCVVSVVALLIILNIIKTK